MLDLSIPGTLDGDNFDEESTERAERDNQEKMSQLIKDFRLRNELYQEYENAVFYENDVFVPEDYKLTTTVSKSPLPSHIVNTIVSALTTNSPKVLFRPVKGGDAGQKNAELRKHFFEASIAQSMEDSEHRWVRAFFSALVMKGEGVIKTVERKKLAWPSYKAYTRRLAKRLDDPDDEEYGHIARNKDEDARRRTLLEKTNEYKRRHPYPIVTTDIIPDTFYYWKTLEGFTLNAEIKDVPYLETLDSFGAGLTGSGKVVPKEDMGAPRQSWGQVMDGVDSLTMYETWDYKNQYIWLAGPGQLASESGVAARGTCVKVIPHKYGDKEKKSLVGPYSHAHGITTHSRLPHRAGLGVLYGFLPLFKLLDSLLTVQSNAAYLTGFPAYTEDGEGGLRLPASQVGEFGEGNETGILNPAQSMLRVTPGRVLPKGIKPIDQPRGSVVIDKVMSDVRSFIELALPSIVQGMMQGDPSGYAVNQAAYLARLAWTPIVDNGQVALARKISFESYLIEEVLRENVYIWGNLPSEFGSRRRQASAGWLSVGPSTLDGAHRYQVKLDPDTPSNKVIDARTHEGLVNNRFETIDDARLEMGRDPEAVERWWQVYDMKQNPKVQEQIVEGVLNRLQMRTQKKMMGAPGEQDLTAPEPGAEMEGAMNGAMGNLGAPFQPGQGNLPLEPVPQGSAPSSGPPGSIAGMAPGTPNSPARHIALPGA